MHGDVLPRVLVEHKTREGGGEEVLEVGRLQQQAALLADGEARHPGEVQGAEEEHLDLARPISIVCIAGQGVRRYVFAPRPGDLMN